MKRLLFVLGGCLLSIFLSGCSVNSSLAGHGKIRVLLDTDANNELDDQHAIAYMLFNGQVFDVDGITTNATRSGGNVRKKFHVLHLSMETGLDGLRILEK